MDTGPIFADPSGRRHRLLWIAGAGAAGVLVIFLGAVAVAVSGGPQAPFTQWVAPHAAASAVARQGASHAAGQSAPVAASAPGTAGTAGATAPVAVATRASASPSAGATASPSASRTPSGQQTTPPGQQASPPGQTKAPNSRKPSSAV